MMSKKVLFALGTLLLVVVVSAAWLTARIQEQASIAIVQNVPYDVRVETTPTTLTAGTEAKVRIRVTQNGKPVDVDETGRLLHVMIVSANLWDTFHTYSPASERKGVYSVAHTFTEPGPYRVWTEIDNTAAEQRHDQNAEQIAYTEITVRGDLAQQEAVVPVTEETVGSYRVRLIASPIVADKPTTLRVEVEDMTGNTVPLSAAEPFLYFMSGKDFTFFRHGHGHGSPDGSGSLENTFPTSGQYVFWVQLEGENVNGIQVPFILTVS